MHTSKMIPTKSNIEDANGDIEASQDAHTSGPAGPSIQSVIRPGHPSDANGYDPSEMSVAEWWGIYH